MSDIDLRIQDHRRILQEQKDDGEQQKNAEDWEALGENFKAIRADPAWRIKNRLFVEQIGSCLNLYLVPVMFCAVAYLSCWLLNDLRQNEILCPDQVAKKH